MDDSAPWALLPWKTKSSSTPWSRSSTRFMSRTFWGSRMVSDLGVTSTKRWTRCGLNIDDPVWDPTVFSKNRDRLLHAEVAALFFRAVLDEAKARGVVSDEHFTVDGTLLEAWASLKSFKKVDDEDSPPPPDDPGNPTVNFHGETRSNDTHASTTDPRQAGAKGPRQRGEVE